MSDNGDGTVEPGTAVKAAPVALGQVPTLFQCGALRMSDGSEQMAWQFSCPNGSFVFFLDPQTSISMARGIIKAAQTGVSGLIVP